MGFLCLVYPWVVVLQAKREGGNASEDVGFLGRKGCWSFYN